MKPELPPPPTTHQTSRLVRPYVPLPACTRCGEDIAEKFGMGSNLCNKCEKVRP